MTNEIVKKEINSLMFAADDSALSKMSEDAKNHVDDTNPDDIAIPRLRILQSASPEVKKSTPEHIAGAEEGDLINTLSKQIFKAEEGVLFVPAKRRVVYLEWKNIEEGGGLINNFGEDAAPFLNALVDEVGKRISPEGNEIVKTYDVYGYLVDLTSKKAEEVVLSMSKTQSKKAKQWNAMIRSLTSKEGNQLPEFAGVYKLITVPESNDKGSWFNYNIELAGYTLAIPEIGESIYKKAKSFSEMISNNEVKAANYEGQTDDGKI